MIWEADLRDTLKHHRCLQSSEYRWWIRQQSEEKTLQRRHKSALTVFDNNIFTLIPPSISLTQFLHPHLLSNFISFSEMILKMFLVFHWIYNLCCPYRHKFNVISICMINIAELTPLQQKLDSPFLTSLQLSMLPLLGMWPLSASSFMIQCWLIIFAHLFQASIGTVSPWKLLCSKDTV